MQKIHIAFPANRQLFPFWNQATNFRIWATHVLKDHIVKGYTLNEQRFREQAEKLTDMRRTVELLARTLANQELVS